jgi:hypothetical protein
MPGTSKTLLSWTAAAAALAVALCLAIACTAQAADRIYWVDGDRQEGSVTTTISHADLAGGNGGGIAIRNTDPFLGLGIDPAAGKLYSFASEFGPILSANLDGTGAAPIDLTGAPANAVNALAVDSIGGRAYWTNGAGNGVSFANLRGGGGGALDTTGVVSLEAGAVAVHPAAGRIYWVNGETIAFANLAGGGAGTLINLQPDHVVGGLAIDASAGRIYWTELDEKGDDGISTFRFANLTGSQSGELDVGQAPVNLTGGLAIDPEAGRIYWANFGNSTIGFASLRGGGGGQLDTTGVTPDEPDSPVLLKTPLAARQPSVTGRTRAGSTLSCQSTWAPDLPESFLYRAPRTIAYQWLRNGRPVSGATAQTVKARLAGRYSCQAIGTNAAGSASSTSSAISVKAALRLGRVRLNRAKGTATLTVAALGGGKLRLGGAGIKAQSAKARAKARLRILPSGRAKKRLQATGRARVKATVTFRPAAGKPLERAKKIVLKLRG